jgi:hypothetical protein
MTINSKMTINSRMTINRAVKASLYLFIACLMILLTGCVKSEQEQPVMEAPPAPPTAPDTQRPAPAQMAPPSPAEVQNVIKRVYQGAVTLDANLNTYFIVGDYNGDSSEDIAIIVRPVQASLADINHELADWMLCDPTKVRQPGSEVVQRELPESIPVVIEKDDLLLAVIHGHGATGWRNSEATQTYLLKNAVRGDMRTYSIEEFRKARKGSPHRIQLRGDLIGQAFEGRTGFIYYNGAKYGWHDPQNPDAEVAARSVR